MEQTIYIGLPKEQPRPVRPRVTLQTLAQWAGPVIIENTRYNMYNTKYSCHKSITQVSLPTRHSTDAGTMGGARSNRKYKIQYVENEPYVQLAKKPGISPPDPTPLYRRRLQIPREQTLGLAPPQLARQTQDLGWNPKCQTQIVQLYPPGVPWSSGGTTPQASVLGLARPAN